MIRILNLEPLDYSAAARSVLEELGELTEQALGRAELLRQIADYDVLIVRLNHQIDRAVLEAGTKLRAVVTATTGLDHIDAICARQRGVEVLSLMGETDFLRQICATSEHTWALLLALLRRLPTAADSVLEGEWDRDRFRGRELYGKRLGIVGLGRLGCRVASYGLAFGMEVSAYDPDPSSWAAGVQRTASLDELLQRSDILSLHAPLSEDTEGMLGPREFGQLPRGAVVVNTARGGLIEEAALVDALRSGHLSGAALDVIRHERAEEKRASSPLLAYARAHDHLLITPHIGGATVESMANTELFMARKLAQFLRGEGEWRQGGHLT